MRKEPVISCKWGRRVGASYQGGATGARSNRDGLGALAPYETGGPKPSYDAKAGYRILAKARRTPDPEHDETASWSLMGLRRTLPQGRRLRAPFNAVPVSAAGIDSGAQ